MIQYRGYRLGVLLNMLNKLELSKYTENAADSIVRLIHDNASVGPCYGKVRKLPPKRQDVQTIIITTKTTHAHLAAKFAVCFVHTIVYSCHKRY